MTNQAFHGRLFGGCLSANVSIVVGKMEFSADPFSPSEIGQSCWSMCKTGSSIRPELLPSSMPIYRDDATREEFTQVANFFGCMDSCGYQYEVKRAIFLIPIVLTVVCIIGVLLICCCCKSCFCHYKKLFPGLKKGGLDSTSSSLDHLSILASSSASVASNESKFSPFGVTAKSLYPISASVGDASSVTQPRSPSTLGGRRRGRKVADLDSTNASLNSWMNPAQESSNTKNQRLLETATKLGRKLMALDKEVDEVKEAQRKAELQSQKKAKGKPRFRF